jgi:hypothetical protein
MKHEFARQISEKCPSKLMDFRSIGAKVFHASKLTYNLDKHNTRLSQFIERTQKLTCLDDSKFFNIDFSPYVLENKSSNVNNDL